MTSRLYLTADGLGMPSLHWPCCLVQAECEAALMPLNMAAEHLQGQPIALVLPMEMCAWVQTDVWPTRLRPQAQAVIFAVEEQLSEDVETLHLSISVRNRQGRYQVWVVNRQRFAYVLELMTQLRIELGAVHVDADLLPNDKAYGVWWLGRWLIGGALDARLALSKADAEVLKPRLPAEMCWLQDGHRALNSATTDARPSNLLQGDFAPVRGRFAWPMALASITLSFTLAWGFTQARSSFLEDQAQLGYALSEQRFKALYPQHTRIVDLPSQLKALQTNTRPDHQDTQVGRLLKLVEQVIGASSVDVQRIEYRRAEGWKLHLTADSFAQLEQLRERGQSSGLPIRLGNASKVQDRVQALLTLESAR